MKRDEIKPVSSAQRIFEWSVAALIAIVVVSGLYLVTLG